MKRPTYAELAYALSQMAGHCQELHACYANDTQPHRADAMAAILAKSGKLAEILYRVPVDKIQSGRNQVEAFLAIAARAEGRRT